MLASFKQASPARQLTLALIAAGLVCLALGSAWFFLLRTPYGVLFNRLRVTDSAAIAAELDRKKIPYRLEDGGTTILVPTDRVDATRLTVASDDVPLKGQVGFELFNNSDLGITDFAQKVNYQRALQGELAKTIQTLDAVESARVLLSITDRSIFREDRVPSKASVTLLPRAGHRLTAQAVQGIQRLVAAAVPDLDPADVVVIDASGRLIVDEVAPVAGETRERRNVEQRYAQDIGRALAGITPGEPRVSVWAGPQPQEQANGSQPTPETDGETRRAFPLHVIITPPAAISNATASALKSAALSAIAPAVAGDGVFVGAPASMATEASSDMPEPAPAAPMDSPKRHDFSTAAIWSGLAAALIVLLLVFISRGPRRRALTEAEREQLVLRFQSLLDGSRADG